MREQATASGLYTGVVTHRRTRPRTHALKYRVFMLLIDLDEVAGLTRRLTWLSAGRFGLMSVRLEDYGDQSTTPLRTQVEGALSAAGLEGGGPIRLLTMPRILGYGFNPISLFFCHAPDGRLSAILYEVRNTFGQRHRYLMAAEGSDRVVRQVVGKAFHVSPFMDMGLTYRFAVNPPTGDANETAGVAITVDDDEGAMLFTAFSGRRRPLTDANLAWAWITHPLLTFKVIAGIHWEAVKLFSKGLRLKPEPAQPEAPVTIGHSIVPPHGVSHA